MKRLLIAAALLCAYPAIAQFTPIQNPHINLLDASGNPCAGCSLYSYIAGTTTPLATYQAQGGSQNTNPIVLDAAGGAFVWTGITSYKFILKSAAGATIWTVDNVGPGNFYVSLLNAQSQTMAGPLVSSLFTAGAEQIGHNHVINVLTQGCVGDGTTSDQSCLASAVAAMSNGYTLYFPAGYTFVQTAKLTLPNGAIVQLDGNLKETITGQASANTGFIANGSLTVRGSGSFLYNEDGSAQSAAITVSNGDVDISGVTFSSPNLASRLRYSILIRQSGTQTLTSFHVHDITTNGVEYGVLRATSTTSQVNQAHIDNNIFYDHTGDPVEWNVGPLDGPLSVVNNDIDYVHTALVNEGIGIGVAGEGPYTYPPPTPQQRILIEGNHIRRARLGIHCEVCYQVKISGNKFSEISASYGPSSIDQAAISSVGSFDVSIDNNTVTESTDGNIWAINGVISAAFVPSSENTVISGNHILNYNYPTDSGYIDVVMNRTQSATMTEPQSATIKDNVVVNGYIRESGVNLLSITDNIVQAPVNVAGLQMTYNVDNSNSRQYSLTVKGNQIHDKFGVVKVSITGTGDENGYANVNLFGGGNSFSLVPKTAAGVTVTPYTYAASGHYVTNSATFPMGPNFQVGDVVYSLSKPTIWEVTTAGTSVPAADTFAIDVAASGTIYRTGATTWTTSHQFGQLIHLDDGGGHTANAVVGGIYFSGTHTADAMALLDPVTGAALNLGAMGAGTITATTAVAFNRISGTDGTGVPGNLASFDSSGNIVGTGTVRTCSGTYPNESCYSVLPDGTVHEWGTIQSGTLDSGWRATATLTFPLTFPTSIQSIICNPGSPGGSGDARNPVACQTNSASTSSVTLNTACVTEIGGGGCSATKLSVTLNWDAWGH